MDKRDFTWVNEALTIATEARNKVTAVQFLLMTAVVNLAAFLNATTGALQMPEIVIFGDVKAGDLGWTAAGASVDGVTGLSNMPPGVRGQLSGNTGLVVLSHGFAAGPDIDPLATPTVNFSRVLADITYGYRRGAVEYNFGSCWNAPTGNKGVRFYGSTTATDTTLGSHVSGCEQNNLPPGAIEIFFGNDSLRYSIKQQGRSSIAGGTPIYLTNNGNAADADTNPGTALSVFTLRCAFGAIVTNLVV